MADDSKLIIGIDGDTKDVEKALANTEKSAKQLANQLAAEYRRAGLSQSEAMAKAWKEIEKQGLTSVQRLQVELHKLEKIGSVALAGLAAGFAAIGTGLAASVGVGAGFEHQMSAVEAISSATADQMTRLTAKAQEMGETSAFTATQAGQAFQFMAQAGWNTEQMLGGIEGIMDLAAASGQDLASTSDIVTDALTAFGLAASDSGRFADVLAKASAKSNTDVGKMGFTFKYVAPLAGALKYSIEDTAVAIGLMANAGIKGEQAGTALRGIFTRLVKPTKDSEAAIEALGLSVTNMDGTMKPLSDVINQMRKSFAGLTDEQKAMYAAMLGGQEAMSGLLAVVNASDQDFANLTREINNAAGSAKEMADIRLDNLTGQFTLFMSALEGVGINIYNNISKPLTDSVRSGTAALGVLNRELSGNMAQSLTRMGESLGRIFDGFVSGLSAALPTILTVLATTLDVIVSVGSTIIDVFTEAYEWVDRLTESFGGIDTVLVGLIAGFATLKAQMVLTAAIAAFQQLGGAIGLATKAQLLLNAAMTANPIGFIISVIGSVAGAMIYLYETNEKFREGFQNVWNAVVRIAQGAYQGLLDVLFNPFIRAFNWLGEALDNVGAGWAGVREFQADFTFAKISQETKDLSAEMQGLKNNIDDLGAGGAVPSNQIATVDNQVTQLRQNVAAAKSEVAGVGTTGGAISGFSQDAQGGYYAEGFVGPKIDAATLRERNKAIAEQAGADFTKDMQIGAEEVGGLNIGQGVSSAIQSALSGEQSWGEAFENLGKNLISSLANSMMNMAGEVLGDTMEDIGGFIVDVFKSFMSIKSPSRVFADLGYWTIAGYAQGLEENAKLAVKPLGDLKNTMTGLMGGIDLGSVSASLSPQLSPAMASGGGTGNVYFSVVNNAPNTKVETEEKRSANGDIELRAYVLSTVAQDTARGGITKQAQNAPRNRRISR